MPARGPDGSSRMYVCMTSYLPRHEVDIVLPLFHGTAIMLLIRLENDSPPVLNGGLANTKGLRHEQGQCRRHTPTRTRCCYSCRCGEASAPSEGHGAPNPTPLVSGSLAIRRLCVANAVERALRTLLDLGSSSRAAECARATAAGAVLVPLRLSARWHHLQNTRQINALCPSRGS